MKFIVCVDPDNGILFNHRRVSRDRKIIEDILNTEGKIAIKEISKPLFEGAEQVEVKEQFDPDDTIFWEEAIPDDQTFDELIVYRFDHHYPSDVKLNVDLQKLKLVSVKSFPGYSHDEIIKEVYRP